MQSCAQKNQVQNLPRAACDNSMHFKPRYMSDYQPAVAHAGEEIMYLRKRLGFVKLAMQHGAHLLPAFAFGQSDTYS